MKRIASGLVSFSFLCLLSVSALANHNDLKEKITVNNTIWVNGTEVKPGRYTVRYNAESGEMTLSMNDKVVVQAKATVTTNSGKFDSDALLTRETPNGTELTGIRLGGQREELQISQVTAEAKAIGFFIPDTIYYVTEDGYVLVETVNGVALAETE